MARNPVHNKPLFEVWGHGTQESADRWDGVMRHVYEVCGIKTQRQLSQATGVSATTLQSCGAFKEPHRMTYRTFMRVCEALDALEGDNDESAHSEACELLSGQLDDVIGRCKSWDYVDLS